MVARALGKYAAKNTNKTKIFLEYSLIPALSQVETLSLIYVFIPCLESHGCCRHLSSEGKAARQRRCACGRLWLLGMCTRPKSNSTEGRKYLLNPRICGSVLGNVFFTG